MKSGCRRGVATICGVATALMACGASAPGNVLEVARGFVRVTFDSTQGGTVRSLHYRHAVRLPLQADDAVGEAGQGTFFALAPEIDGAPVEVRRCTWTVQSLDADTSWRRTFATRLESGLIIERVVSGEDGDSAFRIRDTYRLAPDAAAPVALRLGMESVRSGSGNLRCWFGDAQTGDVHVAPPHVNAVRTLSCTSPALFWRTIDPFGMGMLYQVTVPSAPVTVMHALSDRSTQFATHRWRADQPLTLKPGESVAVDQTVTLDAWARQTNHPPALASSTGTMLTVDLKVAADAGEPLPGAVTVVSATARKGTLEVRQTSAAGVVKTVATFADLTFVPGLNVYRPFTAQAEEAGELTVDAVLRDADGTELCRARAVAIVDGDAKDGKWGAAWQYYARSAPQVTLAGSWREIGAQLARSKNLAPAKEPVAKAAETFEFYRRKFPYHAEMLEGAAEALDVSPLLMIAGDGAMAHTTGTPACMGLFFRGPDGPFQVYTQERGAPDLTGMGYLKMLPEKGYAYHGYTLNSWQSVYGVNEKGLCIGNASLYVDAATVAAAEELEKAARAKGVRSAPNPFHMLLATCATVEDAIRFITDPEAPVNVGVANYLISDATGASISFQCHGLNHNIVRYDPGAHPVFTAGNRPSPRADGQFQQGERPHWALNSYLKERFVAEVMPFDKTAATWEDALHVLHSHAAGGICQHAYENPGGLAVTIGTIANLRTGEFWLTYGPPCRTRMQKFTLGK